MPLALASALDRKRFDVRIIDGRLEKKPLNVWFVRARMHISGRERADGCAAR